MTWIEAAINKAVRKVKAVTSGISKKIKDRKKKNIEHEKAIAKYKKRVRNRDKLYRKRVLLGRIKKKRGKKYANKNTKRNSGSNNRSCTN